MYPPPSQAAFRTDLSVLLDQVGTGKESLSFMKRRIRRLTQQWATAANRLDAKLEQRWRDQKKVKEIKSLDENEGLREDVRVTKSQHLENIRVMYNTQRDLEKLQKVIFLSSKTAFSNAS